MSNGRRTAGGSATAAGALFQSAASAWYCVGILAEQDFPPPLDLPVNTTLQFIRCETDEPVDDILVLTSGEGLIFAQAKHALSLEVSEESDLASAIDQCVRQYLANRSNSQPRRTWNRPLLANTDRLVIVVGEQSSGSIKRDVPAVLENVRSLAGLPLDDAARNEEQRRALRVIRAHCATAWRKVSRSEPTDAELIAFLSLLRIQVLDLDSEGGDSRYAKTLLRTSVLLDPASDSETWGLLGRFCEDLAASRKGADRHVLQRFLLQQSIDLEAPRSYRADIERLKEHTRTSLTLLHDLAVLRAGEEPFSIVRRCTNALVDAARRGSLLVTGDPGAGKSGMLYWSARQCQDGNDCVVLLVDRIASSTRGELRSDLGLEHEFHDVLRNWPSLKPAILLVDALDAAREDRAAQTIRDVIRLTLEPRDRWNVVATIRKFDLRYSEELKELFRGTPPTPQYATDEFKDVRHLNVPVLDDEELSDIAQKSSPLGELVFQAAPPLKELLRNAFNLRLAADLVTAGAVVAEFTAIRTRLELLERYWRYRVLGPGADDREHILRSASEAMVAQRSLRVDRQTVAVQGGTTLSTLLSRNVLVEWQRSEGSFPNRSILSYSHHVLHDYAIARLILRGDRHRLLARLSTDIDLALVARPSVDMHFHYLWANDPIEFWQLSFDVQGLHDAPRILQLVASSVAAESFANADDLDPLCEKLMSQSPGVATQFFTHLVGAIATFSMPLVGSEARPWWPFLVKLSGSLTPAVAPPLQGLLGLAIDRSGEATPVQLGSLGRVARAVLQFAWASTPDGRGTVWVGVQGVCRALGVNPSGREDIKKIIEPERIRTLGYVEVPWLAHEIRHIIDADPDLALDIYRAAFAHEEPSGETTEMSKSRILALRSNRRQDYEMALWELSKEYEYFLDKAPSQATIALTSVLSSYIRQRHRYGERTQQPGQTVAFRGYVIVLQDDGSGIWDSGDVYSNDDGVKVLDAFTEYIRLLSQREDSVELEKALGVLAANESSAIVWRRLLLIASQDGGETLTPLVAPLLLSSKFSLAPDISYAAGEFLRARARMLDADMRGGIEDALLAVADHDYRELARATIIGCLPSDAVVREAMRELSLRLKAEGNVPENKERTYSAHIEPDTEYSYLRRLGVQTNTPEVARLIELYASLREFSAKFLNEDPTEEDVRTIYPSITAVHEALLDIHRDDATAKVIDHAWGYLAAACRAVAHSKGFSCASDIGQAIISALLEAAENQEPEFNAAADAQFDQHPGWGSPAARIDAAKGLALLAQYKDCISEGLRTAIRKASRDPVAAVRFQISSTLIIFYSTDLEFFWEMSRFFAEQERSRGVLIEVVQAIGRVAIARVVPDHLNDAIALFLLIRSRIAPAPADKSEVRRSIDSWAVLAYLHRGHGPSEEHVRALLTTIRDNASALSGTLHSLRDALTYGESETSDVAVRARAFRLLLDMLRGAQQAIRELEAGHTGSFDDWPEADRQSAKEQHELVRGISDQVYFSSGAFRNEKDGDKEESARRSRRFYQEAHELLDELTNVNIAAASHHLIETLAFFVAEDPERVFLRVARSVQSARVGGYQYEVLGVEQVVKLVERYIAEYRSLFRGEALRRALMEMLDTFVDAGWPSARKLVYRLDEIFR